jgi:hypothetical protein
MDAEEARSWADNLIEQYSGVLAEALAARPLTCASLLQRAAIRNADVHSLTAHALAALGPASVQEKEAASQASQQLSQWLWAEPSASDLSAGELSSEHEPSLPGPDSDTCTSHDGYTPKPRVGVYSDVPCLAEEAEATEPFAPWTPSPAPPTDSQARDSERRPPRTEASSGNTCSPAPPDSAGLDLLDVLRGVPPHVVRQALSAQLSVHEWGALRLVSRNWDEQVGAGGLLRPLTGGRLPGHMARSC